MASTRLAVVIWKDRAIACEVVDWKCLGEIGGTPLRDLNIDSNGDFLVGLPPASEASGLLLVGNAIAGFLDTTDYGINDFAGRDDFQPWLRGIRSGAVSPEPLEEMLTVGRAAYSAVGTTEAAATQLGAKKGELDVLYPAPVAVVQVVLVPVEGTSVRDVQRLGRSEALMDALKAAGFTVPAEPQKGLPTDDVLEALRGQ